LRTSRSALQDTGRAECGRSGQERDPFHAAIFSRRFRAIRANGKKPGKRGCATSPAISCRLRRRSRCAVCPVLRRRREA
jgi:hypothetical protein